MKRLHISKTLSLPIDIAGQTIGTLELIEGYKEIKASDSLFE